MTTTIGLDQAPDPGEYDSLKPGGKAAVDQWIAYLATWHKCERPRSHKLKLGLWIADKRYTGTTYTASVAVKRVVPSSQLATYGIKRWDYITYADLTELTRESWSAAPRNHTDDFNLYNEAAALDQFLNDLWRKLDLLWIDDVLTGVTDMSFFERYVFTLMVARLKRPLPLVVSTSLTPDELNDDMSKLVKGMFVLGSAH